MAQDSTIVVHFKPKGQKELINAINQLTVAQKMLTGKAKNYEQALKGLTNRQKRVVDSMVNLNTGTRNLDSSFSVLRSKLLLVSFGMTMVIGTALKFARAFAEQEKSVAMLDRHVDSKTLKNLEKWASAQQKVTTFGDELIMTEMRKIAAINGSEDVIKRATKLAMDLAAATDTDLASAMDKITKTMVGERDQFQNTTQAMREMNEALENAETKTAKLAIMQEFLGDEVDGAAEKYADTFGGALDQTGNTIGDLAELIGEILAPAVMAVITIIEPFAWLIQKLSFLIKPLVTWAGLYVIALGFVAIASKIGAVQTWSFNAALTALNINPIILFLTGLVIALTSVWKIWKYFSGAKEEDMEQTKKQNDVIHKTTDELNKEYVAVWKHTQVMKTRNKVLSAQQKIDGERAALTHRRMLLDKKAREEEESMWMRYKVSKATLLEIMKLEMDEYKLKGKKAQLDRAIADINFASNQVLADKNAILDKADPLHRKINKLMAQKTHIETNLLIVEKDGLEQAKKNKKINEIDLQLAQQREKLRVRDLKLANKQNLASIQLGGIMGNVNPLLTKQAIIGAKMEALDLERDKATPPRLKAMEIEYTKLNTANAQNLKKIKLQKASLKFGKEEAQRRKEAAEDPWWDKKHQIDLDTVEITKQKVHIEKLYLDDLILEEDYLKKIAELNADQAEIDAEIWAAKFESIQKVMGAYNGLVSGVESYIATADTAAQEEEVAAANKIKNEDKKQKKLDEIDEKYAKLQKKRQQQMYLWKVSSALSNTAVGVTQVLADETIKPSWLKFPIAAMIAAEGLAQWGIIHKETFEQGGLVGGRRHAQGGTMIEAEQGEFVMSRSAVDAIGTENLNRMNQGGGGAVNITFTGNVTSKDFIEREAIPQIKEAIRRGADIGVS